MRVSINVYKFNSTKDFIFHVIDEYLKINSSLSYRSFASRIGLSSHSNLSDIKSGKRRVSRRILDKVISYLNIKGDEVAYLDLLYKSENPTSDFNALETESSLQLLRKKNALNFINMRDEYLNNSPLYCFILEALDMSPLLYDLNILQLFFKNKFSQEEIKTTINYMIKIGLLSISESNYILKNKTDNFFTEYEKPNKAVQNYHKRISMLARDAVSEENLTERSFNGVCLNVDCSKISEIDKYLKNFMNDFISKYCDSISLDATTYQLSIQFFKAVNNSALKGVKND